MPNAIVAAALAPVAPPMRGVILDAAERRFADRGYDGCSMRDVASDVGLKNQASVYHYFTNKQELYEAVLRRGVDALVPLWQRPDATLAANLDRLLDYLSAHPHLARLIERAGLEDDRFVQGAIVRLLRPLYGAGLDALRDAAHAWEPSELPHLAAGLYHLIFGYYANAALLRAVMGDDPERPEMLAKQRAFLTSAIARLLGDGLPPGQR